MSTDTIPTRSLSVEVGTVMTPAAAIGGDAGLAEHEDKAAIRFLHQDWLHDINDGRKIARTQAGETVRRIAVDQAGETDLIAIAHDGKRASARFACAVEIETVPARETIHDAMGAAQGEGLARRTERGTVAADYVKTRYGWTIARVAFATV